MITDPAKPANEVITDFGADLEKRDRKKAGSISACDAFREEIERAQAHGPDAMGIWQDLVTEHGFARGYQSVRRFLYRLYGSAVAEARAVIVTAPGEEAQVHYGSGPMVRDESGKYRRMRLFVLTLGYQVTVWLQLLEPLSKWLQLLEIKKCIATQRITNPPRLRNL